MKKPYSWLHSFSSFFVVFVCVCMNHESEASYYTKHCSSVIPHSNTTARCNGNSLPSLSTSYFTGEYSLLPPTVSGRKFYYMQKNLRLRLRPDCFETTAAGVYEVQGFLSIRFPYTYADAPANYSYGGYNRRERGTLRFPMTGLWSEKSRKLCMVGSAPWGGTDRDAVLKLKFDEENPTVYTGVVSGSLESTVSEDDGAHFGPILIFSFLELSNYNYSLVAKGEFPSREGESSLSLDSTEFCSEIEWGLRSLGLDYPPECKQRPPPPPPYRCSLLDHGSLPSFLSLTPIHCDKGSKKARFVATFQNHSFYGFNSFPLASTAIGEASWDEKNNRIVGVACPILNPSLKLGNAVGNCTIVFSLGRPSVLTIRNADSGVSGDIWSSDEDSGYSRKINLTAIVVNRAVALPDQRYQYTMLDRARSSCAAMKKPPKKGDKYPDGQSYDMRFDFIIKNGNGEGLAQAHATPVRVDEDPYQSGSVAVYASGPVASDAESQKRYTKMSYYIRIRSYFRLSNTTNMSSVVPSLDWPVTSSPRRITVTAEGLYDAENGHLCLVACRKLAVAPNSTSTFKDCDIVLQLEVPPMKGKGGGLIKGFLRSTRPKTDALHFNDLVIESSAYNSRAAERSVWRIDMEIAMVLASNTLICIFVALQLFHVKRNPEVLSSASLVMALILAAGSIIPLMVNFEAVFSGYHDKKTLQLGSVGKLEANEAAVRVITMVALLLQLRLLQLVYAAKQSDGTEKNSWSEEKRAGLVSLCLYILGGLLTLLLNSMRKPYGGRRYSVWGDLRSYAGLILDGFLLPQILLNIFGGFTKEALCRSFYVGTSAVRLVPHAYNQYRAHNYPKHDVTSTYYYANPRAELYSTAWDIVIPCGIVAFAVIVFLQQRNGGRCFLPQRFRVVEMYEKVPNTADNQ